MKNSFLNIIERYWDDPDLPSRECRYVLPIGHNYRTYIQSVVYGVGNTEMFSHAGNGLHLLYQDMIGLDLMPIVHFPPTVLTDSRPFGLFEVYVENAFQPEPSHIGTGITYDVTPFVDFCYIIARIFINCVDMHKATVHINQLNYEKQFYR